MFKVGDKVRRRAGQFDRTVREVTEVFPNGWFNYEGARSNSDYHPKGGCCPQYWELVQDALSRSSDPATSKGKRRANKYADAIMRVLFLGAAMTGKELAEATGHPLNCITPRFAPLRRKGLIKPLTRLVDGAAHGRPEEVASYEVVKRDKQIVWVLA